MCKKYVQLRPRCRGAVTVTVVPTLPPPQSHFTVKTYCSKLSHVHNDAETLLPPSHSQTDDTATFLPNVAHGWCACGTDRGSSDRRAPPREKPGSSGGASREYLSILRGEKLISHPPLPVHNFFLFFFFLTAPLAAYPCGAD